MNEENKIALNDKQERFCYEYCIDFNATQAAIRSGYSKKTAKQIGSRLLTNVDVQTRVKQMQANLAETAGISALMIVREHAKIAFSNVGQLRDGWIKLKDFKKLTDDQKACIQEVATKTVHRTMGDEPVEEEYVKVKLYDKQKSLDSLTDILGHRPSQKIDSTVEHKNQQIIIQKTYETDNKAD
ncbi:phage terminase small subunit [Dysgonomonas alginatilytica]|uniref:Phage terminase small subunit n=1 Tax=Dysgonomonas alginatilytica TaxID=1605892 RepID=A0A2V3PMH1_9BACT|nr:terminase small subunit [Dysgonomonas alginatilytica]PXV61193.1 phage terminase small subunit [Dysgonomonas alginatilytica]